MSCLAGEFPRPLVLLHQPTESPCKGTSSRVHGVTVCFIALHPLLPGSNLKQLLGFSCKLCLFWLISAPASIWPGSTSSSKSITEATQCWWIRFLQALSQLSQALQELATWLLPIKHYICCTNTTVPMWPGSTDFFMFIFSGSPCPV